MTIKYLYEGEYFYHEVSEAEYLGYLDTLDEDGLISLCQCIYNDLTEEDQERLWIEDERLTDENCFQRMARKDLIDFLSSWDYQDFADLLYDYCYNNAMNEILCITEHDSIRSKIVIDD